jgi:DUF4097 and DUF4098 domain-containing protein YvlB
MKRKLLFTCIFFIGALPGRAQLQDNQTPTLNCDQTGHGGHLVRHCEMREQTIPSGGRLAIDASPNGGIHVKGWTRNDVLVRARVETGAPSDQEARAIAAQVFLQAAAGHVAATGPAMENEHHWSVSYEVFVPQRSDLSVTSHNGGIHLSDLNGQIEFKTQNGGIHLARLAGNVKGETTNGGVHVELAGSRWEGQGLDVRSVNGGVHVSVPAMYSAHLETSTVNGRVNSNIPELATPREKQPRQAGADIGGGGAMIRVSTSNGGVHINRAS